jgi:hypothetical protein
MLSKCANPNCSAPFLYFREGKLFRWDGLEIAEHPEMATASHRKPIRKAEFFWLCGNCASHMTVVFREDIGFTVRPLVPARKAASSSLVDSRGHGILGGERVANGQDLAKHSNPVR